MQMFKDVEIPLPHKQYGMYYVEEAMRDAAYRGDVQKIKKLMKTYPDLDVNAVNEYKENAIYIACKKNQHQVVDLLLQHPQINIEQPTVLGNKCLLIAAWNDNTALAKKLVERGADVAARTNPDREYHAHVSALDIAVERDNQTLVSFLQSCVAADAVVPPRSTPKFVGD